MKASQSDTPAEVPLIIGGASLASHNSTKDKSKKKDSGCQLV